jgi:murein DD-endopeptidase MepM/ murein hydrolase activator NlpD
MRRVLPLALGVALLCAPAQALATTGGAEAGGDPGGSAYDPAAPPLPRPTVREFSITPGTLRIGAPARVVVRVDAPTPSVRFSVDIVAAGARRAAARLVVGRAHAGRRVTRSWVPRTRLAAGRYTARLHVTDARGGRLRRTRRAPGRTSLRVVAPPAAPATPAAPPAPPPGAVATGVFPVQGPYDLGGPDMAFGAAREGHAHQGQDISAAEGTPIVSPRAGAVYFRSYQAGGAGHYLVIRIDDGRDLVFMHLRAGSLLVARGDAVAAGQRIADVGSTGVSEGPHLHFEIWPGGWYAKGSQPIDPLPQLRAWPGG